MRLIDADALIETIGIRLYSGAVMEFVSVEDIAKQPTVDAVPVIRCKDCRWYKTNYSWDGKEYRICVIDAYEPVRQADDFCSRAERKEE